MKMGTKRMEVDSCIILRERVVTRKISKRSLRFITSQAKPRPSSHLRATMDSMVPYDTQVESFHKKLSEKKVPNRVRSLLSDHVPDLGYYALPAQMQRLSMEALFDLIKCRKTFIVTIYY